MKNLFALLLSAGLLTGCASSEYATFVTKTSLAVLDVDTAPAETSIAYSRSEGYVGPRFKDGSVYPVVGFVDAKGRALFRETRQVFAGGQAAVLVLQGGDLPPTSAEAAASAAIASGTGLGRGKGLGADAAGCDDKRLNPHIYFATGTSVGLRAGFAEGSPVPVSFNFGYRRKEVALIPVAIDCQPSILATHDSDGGTRESDGAGKPGLGVVQYFATGAAADALARRADTRAIFTGAIKAAADAASSAKK